MARRTHQAAPWKGFLLRPWSVALRKTPLRITTSASSSVDPVSQGASNLVYRLSADAITSLKFMNGFGAAVNTVSLTAGVKQAIVSFNASSGFVSVVVPLASKAGVPPTVAKRGSDVVMSGAFAGAFDSHGRNLAPSGASQVVIDRKGELVSAK